MTDIDIKKHLLVTGIHCYLTFSMIWYDYYYQGMNDISVTYSCRKLRDQVKTFTININCKFCYLI